MNKRIHPVARLLLPLFCFVLACTTAGLHAQSSPLDTHFQPPFFVDPSPAARVTLLPSGKYVAYFSTNALLEAASEASPQNEVTPITRYNPDGTRDTSFEFKFNSEVERDYDNITAVAPLPDDSLYVAAFQNPYGSNAAATSTLLHLNSNGSIDSSFGFSASFGPHEIRGITVQSDGNILVGGFFTNFAGSRSGIARVLANGTPDFAFNKNAPQVTGGTYGGVWANPAVQPADSKILMGGDFTAVGNTKYPGIARLNANGTLDNTFVPSGFTSTGAVRRIIVLANGQIVLAGRFSIPGGINNAALIRLDDTGTRDPTFTQTGGLGAIKALAVLSDGSYVATNQSLYHFDVNGKLDTTSFHQPALLLNQSSASGIQGAFSVNVQTDGKILIGGTFTDVDDEGVAFNGPRFGVARFNSDGTLDSTFTTSHQTAVANPPNDFVLQPDGNTFVSFALNSPSGYPFATIPHNFGRVGPSGAVDSGYDPLAQQSQILVASGFIRFDDTSFVVQGAAADLSGNNKSVRVLSDGSLTSLPAGGNNGSDTNPSVATGLRLADGSALLVAADAESIIAGNVVARFFPTGALDTSFAPDPQITAQMVQRDGNGNVTAVAMTMKLLASYNDGRALFSYLGFDGIFHLVRLQSNGSIDPSFTAVSTAAADVQTTPNQLVTDPGSGNTIIVNVLTSPFGYADAEIDSADSAVIVGSFQSYGSSTSKGIVRVTSSGAVDTSFNAGSGVQWRATPQTATFFPLADNIETQGDGKFIVTGTFEVFNGITAPGIVRLNSDGSVDNAFVAPAARAKNDPTPTYFKRQFDGSFLLSGPYTSANRDLSPSFLHFFGPPVINSPLSASATIGRPFFYQFETGGATSLSVAGLPDGLSFDPALATIVGTTNQAPADVPVTLSASNAYGTTTATLILTIVPSPASGPMITSSTSATGRTGAPFHFQVITLGGSPATTLSVANLPPGLTFDAATGLISGIPQSAGSTAVILNVTDLAGNATGILQLTFSGDPGLPVIVSPDSALLTSGRAFSYTINAPSATGPEDNTTYTLVGTLPAGLFFDEKSGVISGTYQGSPMHDGSVIERALSGGIITNVQLFATNSHGTSTVPLVFFNAPIGSVNISTRLDVGTADNVLIGGFIVTGNAPKKVLIRAIGPSITANGQPLAGALQDTTLELYQGATLIGSNDDWRSDQEQEIIDTGVPPTDDRESAIVATLAANNTGYTAIVRGKGGEGGIGLAEIYDLGTASLDASSVSHLANISTRGTVLTADNVMIGGFIISGANTNILARAIGPSLTQAGISGALQDTMLELHDSSGALVASNDDWRTTQQQQIVATGIPPNDNRESAIVATLQPGAYTAVVRGKNDSTGVALVEIYSLQ